jgi:hypothetical protein
MDSFGVHERNIVIHGHSIGGGIMAKIIGVFPQAVCVKKMCLKWFLF